MAGWIKLQRDITEHWCASDPNFFAVWFRMVAEANFKDNKTILNGSPVHVKRGQLIFGLNAFSNRSGVSVSKLRRIIRILSDECMIDRQIFNKYSIISITNYDKHQSVDKQKAGKRQADDRQTTTLKEGKEGKEGKVDKNPTTKGSRIDGKFKDGDSIPDEYIEAAAGKGLSRERACVEFRKMFDHFIGEDAKYPIKKNWKRAYLKWITNSIEWNGNHSGNRNGRPRGSGTPLINIATELINELGDDIP